MSNEQLVTRAEIEGAMGPDAVTFRAAILDAERMVNAARMTAMWDKSIPAYRRDFYDAMNTRLRASLMASSGPLTVSYTENFKYGLWL